MYNVPSPTGCVGVRIGTIPALIVEDVGIPGNTNLTNLSFGREGIRDPSGD